MKYTDITSHEIACRVLKKDPKKVTSIHDQQDDIANAINKLDKFKPSWKNEDQQKWTPYFYVDSSGLRFIGSIYVDSYSHSYVGSRLCHYVSSEAESYHIGKTFIELFKQHYYGR